MKVAKILLAVGVVFNIVLGTLLLTAYISSKESQSSSYTEQPPMLSQLPEERDSRPFWDRYVFNTLTDEDKVLYITIYDALTEYRESDPIVVEDIDTVNRVYNCVMIDNPELFYVEGIDVIMTESASRKYCTLSGNYSVREDQMSSLLAQADKEVDRIIASIPAGCTDYEKIVYIYEYIAENTDYVPESQNNQNIISVLLNKSSVCSGYAKTFQYIMYRLGIPCTIVTGRAGVPSVNHAWNMVELDGEYYHVDATWGDMQNYKIICYDYLMIDDETISETHRVVSDIVYPECSSDDYNYYVVTDTLITSKDITCLDDILPRINVSPEPTMTLKFDNDVLFHFYKDYLIGEAKLFEYMDGPIDYVLNANHRTLTIERRF